MASAAVVDEEDDEEPAKAFMIASINLANPIAVSEMGSSVTEALELGTLALVAEASSEAEVAEGTDSVSDEAGENETVDRSIEDDDSEEAGYKGGNSQWISFT